MAAFSKSVAKELKELEENVKRLEVANVPLNSTRIIGEGSSALVFDFNLRGKPAAVKKFKQPLPKKLILRAAASLISLSNKNIVRFRGYSLRPAALIFEKCEVWLDETTCVHTLKELVNEFNDHDYYNLKERVAYIMQICEGLKYLHEMNVLHTDLKPTNILVKGVKETITIKLADFNEVKRFKETCLSTLTHSLKGM